MNFFFYLMMEGGIVLYKKRKMKYMTKIIFNVTNHDSLLFLIINLNIFIFGTEKQLVIK